MNVYVIKLTIYRCAMRHSKQSSPVKNIPSTQARMSTVLDTPLVHGFATAIILKNGVSMQWCAIIVYKVSDKRIIMNNSKPI